MLQTLGLLAMTAAHAAPPDLDAGVRVHLERAVDAPADQVWAFLGEDFARFDWVDGLESRALLEGEVPADMTVDPDAPVPGRVVLGGRGEQLQVLVDFDADGRTFTFRAGDPPGLLSYAHNQHTVVDLGGGRSRVDIDVVLVPRGVARLLMKGRLEAKFTEYMVAYLDAAEAGIEAAAGDDSVAQGVAR